LPTRLGLAHQRPSSLQGLASFPVAVYLNHPLDTNEALGGIRFVT
jgi:hypothetical protein